MDRRFVSSHAICSLSASRFSLRDLFLSFGVVRITNLQKISSMGLIGAMEARLSLLSGLFFLRASFASGRRDFLAVVPVW
jgi:hypothetical protein